MAEHTLKRVTESRQGLDGSRRRLSRDVSFESVPREDSIRSDTRASQREGGTAGIREGAPSRSGARSGLAGGGTVSELIGRGGGGDAAGRQVFFKEGFIYVKEDRARAMGTGAGDANSSKEVHFSFPQPLDVFFFSLCTFLCVCVHRPFMLHTKLSWSWSWSWSCMTRLIDKSTPHHVDD
jgi:hypothetical protein